MRIRLRVRWWALVVVAATAFGSLVGPPGAGGPMPAEASGEEMTEAAKWKAIATVSGRTKRLDAIERLRRLDSSESRAALDALADSKDEQLAAFAMAALARFDDSAAEAKLKSVIESGSRSDTARSLALTAWLRLRARDGDDWEDVSAYVAAKTAGNAALQSTVATVQTSAFGAEEDR